MGHTTRQEYLQALEEAGLDGDQFEGDDTDFENPDTLSEAERIAQAADSPKKRKDGQVITSVRVHRKLTTKQLAFVAAKVAGKSNMEAYREAYPDDTSSDRVISANAYKLTRHPVIGQMLEDAWGETVEALTEDVAATKRYVLRQLLALTKHAKQEGSKLKALELMGKAAGVFTPTVTKDETPATAEQLKRELAGHLKLMKG